MFCYIVMLNYVRYAHNYDYNTNMFVFHLLYVIYRIVRDDVVNPVIRGDILYPVRLIFSRLYYKYDNHYVLYIQVIKQN